MVCVRGRMPGSGPGVRSRGGFLYELNLPPYPRWQKVKNCPTSGRQQVGAWRAPGDGRSGEGGAPGTLREIRGRNRPWPMPFYFGDVAGGGTIWGVRIFRPSRGFGRLPMRPGLQTELRLGAPEIWRTTGDPRAAGNWPVFRLFSRAYVWPYYAAISEDFQLGEFTDRLRATDPQKYGCPCGRCDVP